jgi:Protein of unknown function (DUF2809)
MAAVKRERSRLGYAVAMLVVIGLGLASRKFPGLFPRFMGKYPGDALWALMIFCGWGAALPAISTMRLAVYSLATCYLDECSQLYRAPWIDNIRSTTLGHLVLGSGFMWGDFVACTLGICLGCLGESAKRLGVARQPASNSN